MKNKVKITSLIFSTALIFAVFVMSTVPALAQEKPAPPFDPGSYHLTTSRMNIDVGELASDSWQYFYDVPSNLWGESCYWELFSVYTTGTGTLQSDSDFTTDTYFSATNDEAVLHSSDIQVKMQVLPNTERSFKIKYTITNTGSGTLNDVRFFEIVDYDVPDTTYPEYVNDVAWYATSTDYVWIKDDNYFQNGFRGDIASSDHGMAYFDVELWTDPMDGDLNSANTYGNGVNQDPAVGLQWNFGDIGAGESQTVTVTFWFGVPADEPIPPEVIPEFSTIALPVASILGMLFFFNHRKRRREEN